jgi:hypothetical protein
MSHGKTTKRAKSRPASKSLEKKPAERKDVADRTARCGSKRATVIAQLSRPTGATIAAIVKATGWQQHSVRGFLAGVVRKKVGLTLESVKTDGVRVYRVVAAKRAKSKLNTDHAARQAA